MINHMDNAISLIHNCSVNGVPFRRIVDVVLSIRSGLNPRKNFVLNRGGSLNYVTVKEITTGRIVFSEKTDKIDREAWNKIQTRSHLQKDDVLLSAIGTIGKVAVVDIETDNWNCSESVLLLKPNKTVITPRFLKYVLESKPIQSHFTGTAVGSTLKGIRIKDLESLSIPVPPLEVQDEIVRILDDFAELSAELIAKLVAELAEIKRQHGFYRDSLFKLDCPKVKLSEVCSSIKDGMHNLPKTNFVSGKYPILSAQNINNGLISYDAKRYVDEGTFVAENKRTNVSVGDVLLTIVASIGKTAVVKEEKQFLLQRSVCVLHPSNTIDSSYLKHCLDTFEMQTCMTVNSHGSAQAGIYLNKVADLLVPLPPLAKQKEIADLLDDFDVLNNELINVLQAEIEARKKQYEYYRDKLLSFKEVKA